MLGGHRLIKHSDHLSSHEQFMVKITIPGLEGNMTVGFGFSGSLVTSEPVCGMLMEPVVLPSDWVVAGLPNSEFIKLQHK